MLDRVLDFPNIVGLESDLGISPWRLPANLRYLISSASFAELEGIGQNDVSQIASLIGQTLLGR